MIENLSHAGPAVALASGVAVVAETHGCRVTFHPRITSLSPQTLSIHSQHVEGEHGAGGCEKIVRHPCAWHL